MSGKGTSANITVANMKQRLRRTQKTQNSPPTPPKAHWDDIPEVATAPGTRRSGRGKAPTTLPLDTDAPQTEQQSKPPRAAKNGKKDHKMTSKADPPPAPETIGNSTTTGFQNGETPDAGTTPTPETAGNSTTTGFQNGETPEVGAAAPTPETVGSLAMIVFQPSSAEVNPAVPPVPTIPDGPKLGINIPFPPATSTVVSSAEAIPAMPPVPTIATDPKAPSSPASSEKSVANELVPDPTSKADPTDAGMLDPSADMQVAVKVKGKGKAKAKATGRLDEGKESSAVSKPQKGPLQVVLRVPASTGEMEEYDEKLGGRKAPSKEDYEAWRQQYGKAGDIEKAFETLASSNLDWCRIPQGAWDVRSGPVGKEVRARLEAVAQGAAFLISTIAADAGISKAAAWKHTGLLQVENRASNGYNLFCRERAKQMREENEGNAIGDAKETNKALSQEWADMEAGEREALTDRLRREHFKADANMLKDDLVSTQQRERFLQDQADALSTVATQLNVRTDLIMLGMLVLPATSVAPAVSTCFTSSSVAVEAWKRHDKDLDAVMCYIAKRAEGGVTSDLVAWPAPEEDVITESQGWHRNKCLARALKYLCTVQKMTAPWNEMANGEFLWRDSNKHCAKKGYVLCGWPVVEMFPGSVKSDNTYSAHKSLGKGGGRQILTKFTNDRLSVERKASNVISLQYFAIDALTVTEGGIIVETATALESELHRSRPLSDYPQLDRPVLVSSRGQVLVTYREIEAEEARRHRIIVNNAMDALNDEEEPINEATDNEGTEDSTAKAPVPKLPALRFAEGRAPIVPAAKNDLKAEDTDHDVEEEEEEADTGKAKGKAKAKAKGSRKRSRKDTILSSDEDEDAGDVKGEPSSKRRKGNGKPTKSNIQPSS